LENIEAVLRAIESGPVDEEGFPAALKDLDRQLADAVVHDLRALLSRILSQFGSRKTAKAHGYRTRQILTCFGWISIRYAYVRRAGTSAWLRALGVTARSTAAARDRVVRCAALCGSFMEGRDMLKRLTGIHVSVSKLRTMALEYGERCLRAQEEAAPDVRSYARHTPKEGETETTRTLFCMVDGTGAPCVKKDTVNTPGKQGEAGTRQIRVALFGEYGWLDNKGRPSPFKGSFSYAVSGGDIAEVTGLVRQLGVARGYRTGAQMQCVADGEEALEKALRDAFPDAIFTNDFMHACGHLHACCESLGFCADAMGKEYRFLKGLLYRCSATAVIRRLETRYGKELGASPTAEKELDYLRRRKQNMDYGRLRKDGFFIASGHVEAAARVLVVRRCKQAGMHWRHQNAVRISAILAHLRSAA
jgi:CheY-like chemotaxis protein